MPLTTHIVIAKPYFVCEKPGTPPLFTREGKPLPPKFHDWDEVIWGIPGKKLGRLPTALYIAHEFSARVFMVTVGSARFESGQTEAEWMDAYIFGCYAALKKDFPTKFSGAFFASEGIFTDWLRSIIVFEKDGHNTSTSLDVAAGMIGDLSKGRHPIVHVVTSANHVSRSLRDTIVAFEKNGLADRVTIGAIAAQTCYGGKTAADVVIHELGDPNHKPWAEK